MYKCPINVSRIRKAPSFPPEKEVKSVKMHRSTYLLSRLTSILHFLLECYVLRVIQFWFDYPVYALKRCWNLMDRYHVAIDSYQSMQDVHLTRSISYGAHPREKYHLMSPARHHVIRGNIIYVHGGGFVASCREMYYNSFTFLVRRGYRVFVVDYPLSPQSRHPQPTLSLLRCLHSLKKQHSSWKMEHVHMVGDSAGANLILLATAVQQNKHVWQHFQQCLPPSDSEEMSSFELPNVTTCVSIYGMIHRRMGGRAKFPVGLGLHFLWECVSNYPNLSTKNQSHESSPSFPVSFDDVLEHFGRLVLPPTQFVVGDGDPLLHDSLHVHRKMKSMSSQSSTLHVYQGGFHGFFGLPPEWQPFDLWKAAALPCSSQVYEFLNDHTSVKRDESIPMTGSRRIGWDWFGVIVILQLAVVMPMFIVGAPVLLCWWLARWCV